MYHVQLRAVVCAEVSDLGQLFIKATEVRNCSPRIPSWHVMAVIGPSVGCAFFTDNYKYDGHTFVIVNEKSMLVSFYQYYQQLRWICALQESVTGNLTQEKNFQVTGTEQLIDWPSVINCIQCGNMATAVLIKRSHNKN